MNTLKISLALVLLSGIHAFAQTKTMYKPIALNKQIKVTEAAKAQPAVRKVNPLYQKSIVGRVHLLDVEKNEQVLSVGSANPAVAEIKAFPNPFTTQIDVIITDGAMGKSVYKAYLYDMNGKRVHAETLNANQSSLQLATLSAGIYFLHIEKNGAVIKQEKFIKE